MKIQSPSPSARAFLPPRSFFVRTVRFCVFGLGLACVGGCGWKPPTGPTPTPTHQPPPPPNHNPKSNEQVGWTPVNLLGGIEWDSPVAVAAREDQAARGSPLLEARVGFYLQPAPAHLMPNGGEG